MSVEFKAATNFLRSIATAAKVMADALEQVEKDLGSATAAAPLQKEEVPTIMPEAKVVPPILTWAQSRIRPTPNSDVSGAEQTSLATEAAEYGSTATFLDGVDKEKILSGRVPVQGAGITDFSFKERQLAREMKERKLRPEPERLLDRFLEERTLNPGKTCLGVKHVVEAYKMSILTGIVMVEGETIDYPMYKGAVEIEILPADSEDAKRLPEGAKVVGLLKYACEFTD